jgi:hypothetical protein
VGYHLELFSGIAPRLLITISATAPRLEPDGNLPLRCVILHRRENRSAAASGLRIFQAEAGFRHFNRSIVRD